jgi:hypothetical protein
MEIRTLFLALMTALVAGLAACGDREEIRAERLAEQSAADEAACQAQGAPGSAEYDACRQGLEAQRAQKAEIEYQKRRDFDRVLGGLDNL